MLTDATDPSSVRVSQALELVQLADTAARLAANLLHMIETRRRVQAIEFRANRRLQAAQEVRDRGTTNALRCGVPDRCRAPLIERIGP